MIEFRNIAKRNILGETPWYLPGQNFKKLDFLAQCLLLFSKTEVEEGDSVRSYPSSYWCYRTGISKVISIFQFIPTSSNFQKSVYKGDFSLNWQTKPMSYFFQEKYVFQKTKI